MVRHKEIYWKCVDCGSMINDECMHSVEALTPVPQVGIEEVISGYAEFCYGCMNYHPEVVIAYD